MLTGPWRTSPFYRCIQTPLPSESQIPGSLKFLLNPLINSHKRPLYAQEARHELWGYWTYKFLAQALFSTVYHLVIVSLVVFYYCQTGFSVQGRGKNGSEKQKHCGKSFCPGFIKILACSSVIYILFPNDLCMWCDHTWACLNTTKNTSLGVLLDPGQSVCVMQTIRHQ